MAVRILTGDCRDVLKTLPDESVHCVVSSPPYFGLRDYGTAKWEGGDADCDHIEMAVGMSEKNTLGPDKHLPSTNAANVGRAKQYRHTCAKCGARREDSQIGLEPTPDAFVSEMVAVFREVRRVLRSDGTLWLNLGDSYFNTSPGSGGKCVLPGAGKAMTEGRYHNAKRDFTGTGLKPKDLIGIPWRVAFALQADGWWLRQDIIWAKPNPMPESVTDRCTKAHEYLFLMAKSERYFYDADAVREEPTGRTDPITSFGSAKRIGGKPRGGRDSSGGGTCLDGIKGANRRSVWAIATRPYSGAHFATFPPALIEPCIKAGCPAGGTVLDPFGGAGTTGLVADRLGRNAILIELNPDYAAMAEKRIDADAGMFAVTDRSALTRATGG